MLLAQAQVRPARLEVADQRFPFLDIEPVYAPSEKQCPVPERQEYRRGASELTLDSHEAAARRPPVVLNKIVYVAPEALVLLRTDGLSNKWVLPQKATERTVRHLVCVGEPMSEGVFVRAEGAAMGAVKLGGHRME
jgi:hypothetical protein